MISETSEWVPDKDKRHPLQPLVGRASFLSFLNSLIPRAPPSITITLSLTNLSPPRLRQPPLQPSPELRVENPYISAESLCYDFEPPPFKHST